jgi:phosphatidylglycerophosphate synthase
MIVEAHAIVGGYHHWFGPAWAVLLIIVMLVLGAFTRFGADELVPVRADQRGTMADGFARIGGLVTFFFAFVCLFFVEFNLFYGNEHPERYWMMVFVIPWAAYGLVALAGIIVRQFFPSGYPEGLSVFKDVGYARKAFNT